MSDMALANKAESVGANSFASAVSGASAQWVGANTERNGLRIGVDAGSATSVYILLGTGTASATNFHIALLASTGHSYWDGLISGVVWAGAVQVFGTGTRVSLVEV